MKLGNLLDFDKVLDKSEDIDTEREVVPTRKNEDCYEDSLLFILKPAMKEENGAFNLNTKAYAVVTDRPQLIRTNAKIISVENAREAYAHTLSNFYAIDYSRIKIIGVTGTNGKTTTATLIYELLLRCGRKAGFIGTGKIEINRQKITDSFYSMTTPDPEDLYPTILKMIKADCEFIVMEVSSHALSLGKVAPITFELGLFTNLTEEHLDYHKNMEDYFLAKMLLFKNCKRGIFNIDDSFGARGFTLAPCEKISVGIINPAEVYATEIDCKNPSGITYFYRRGDHIFKVKSSLIGCYNVYNTLLALCAAIMLGVKPCAAKRALTDIKGIPGRMEKTEGDVTVVIDYAHTPFAFENLLKTLKSIQNPRQKLHVVFGCGGERDREKRSLIGTVVTSFADFIYVTEDNSRGEDFLSILSDIERGIPKSQKHRVIEKRDEAIFTAILNASPGDTVAIIGKGQEEYIIDKNGKRPFFEKEIILSALKARGGRSYENNS
jgi:UDP-N-acetylmuramoyl-L-alanyl-D-glutamate--2,6-diaminopimelate ligase